jgi:hypothetical protein
VANSNILQVATPDNTFALGADFAHSRHPTYNHVSVGSDPPTSWWPSDIARPSGCTDISAVCHRVLAAFGRRFATDCFKNETIHAHGAHVRNSLRNAAAPTYGGVSPDSVSLALPVAGMVGPMS